MSDRVRRWRLWVHVFDPLMSREPEFFPLLLRLYADFDIPKVSKKSDHSSRMNSWRWESEPKIKSINSRVQILFDPQNARSNYLGSCRRIADSFQQASYAFLQSSRHPITYDKDDPILLFDDVIGLFNGFRTVKLWLMLLFRVAQVDLRLCGGLLRASVTILKSICIIQSRLIGARRLMRENGTEWFITPNEQSPLSSVFLVAAKLEGVRTGQFLHGMPTMLYTPSFSDKFWVWGDASIKMLNEGRVYGFSKIEAIGALEFPFELTTTQDRENKGQEGGEERCLLFLSQLVGDQIWETQAFSTALRVVVEAVTTVDEDWHVRVRLHPQADQSILEAVKEELAACKCSYSISSTRSLRDDIKQSDFVCTASSSAIIEALLQSKPLRLIWNDGLNLIHGFSYLSDSWVSRSAETLEEALMECSEPSEESCRKAIFELAGRPGSARYLAQYVEADIFDVKGIG